MRHILHPGLGEYPGGPIMPHGGGKPGRWGCDPAMAVVTVGVAGQ